MRGHVGRLVLLALATSLPWQWKYLSFQPVLPARHPSVDLFAAVETTRRDCSNSNNIKRFRLISFPLSGKKNFFLNLFSSNKGISTCMSRSLFYGECEVKNIKITLDTASSDQMMRNSITIKTPKKWPDLFIFPSSFCSSAFYLS